MPGQAFDDKGRLIIPVKTKEAGKKTRKQVVVNAAYCPNGHNLVDVNFEVSGHPAIVMKFKGQHGESGRVAISAVLGDMSYSVPEGVVDPDDPLQLTCPECNISLDVLSDCSCSIGALRIMLYLYPRRDPYQAIAFCNKLACKNSVLIRSGEVIRMR